MWYEIGALALHSWRELILFEDKLVEANQRKELEDEASQILGRVWRLNEEWRRNEGPSCYL